VVAAILSVLLPWCVARAQVMDGCPHEGEGGDPQLNVQKNRDDAPGSFDHIPLSRIRDWTRPAGTKKAPRSTWSASARAAVAEREAMAVEIIGYLVARKLEGPETCNCKSDKKVDYDFHLWVTAKSGQAKPDSVVVEVTPLLRAQHPTWTEASLGALQGKRVRVSGLVMFDQEHPEQIGKHRKGLWEIHPIFKIETFSGGAWHEL
jgi:hypothetical protein